MSDTSSTNVAKTGFASNEPVVVAHFVTWAFLQLGAIVVGHTNLVTQVQWNSLTTGLFPFVTAAILSVLAVVLRKYVSPAWKKVQGEAGKLGLPVPSNELIDQLAEQVYEAFLNKQAAVVSLAPAPEILAAQVPAHAGNDGVVDPDWTPPINPLP
jgi:hypothetical protein